MRTFDAKGCFFRRNCMFAARSLLVAGFLFSTSRGLPQAVPVLTIAPTGTNGLSITITNAVPTYSYELWWTPVLGDPVDYPWTAAAVGNIGQTNFILSNWTYPAAFFRGLLDTNAVPLWEAANPSNPTNGILKITIASPANGSTLN